VTAAGPFDLLVFGFDAAQAMAPEVTRQLNLLRSHDFLRVLDVLFVSKDEQGAFSVGQEPDDLNPHPALVESALWDLFDGDDPGHLPTDPGHPPTDPLELQSAREVGLDLDSVEGLERLIGPGTCALLVLVELRWASDLLAAVLGSDGFPVLSGRLEPETMLVIGLKLAAAARSVSADERTTALRGAAMLDALASTRMASTTAADVIQPLIAAGLLNDGDIEDAIGALAHAGLVPRSSLAAARDQASATVAEIARLRG
jgi:uncharacterized membrane protein